MPKGDDGQHGADVKEHKEHKQKPVLDPEERGGAYTSHVAQYVTDATWQRNEVASWLKELSADGSRDTMTVEEHVAEVFSMGGVTEFADRIRQVEAAVKRQQQLLLDRKNRKKERLREAATSKDPRKNDGGGQNDEADAKGGAGGVSATPRVGQIAEGFITAVATDKPEVVWKEVQSFRTQEEAIRFIVECQPIDYQPEIQASSDNIETILTAQAEAFPRYENTREALAHVLQMDPRPSEFSSMASEFKRRLRIRKAEPDELATEHAPRHTRGKSRSLLLKHRMSHSGGSHRHHDHHSAKEKKAWIVETAGVLFERPASLRELKKDITTKYFIAVNKDVEKEILADGFRVKQRCSIPCSATPQEAVAAFTRNEQRAGHTTNARAIVLAVTVPPEIDVVAHKKSGFMIRCKELPPECLSRIKRSEAGAM